VYVVDVVGVKSKNLAEVLYKATEANGAVADAAEYSSLKQ
jgi:hypothetical protein